jgi:transposase
MVMQRGDAMGAPVPLRDDIPAEELRRLARQERDGRIACRLLGVANALDGMSRERAARQADMERQTLRDWVIRFNAEGVEGLRDRPKSGRPPWLDEGQQAAFKALVPRGPDPERDGVSSWRAKDLCRPVEQRFGVVYSENSMLRLLHDLDLSWQKARPRTWLPGPTSVVGPERRARGRPPGQGALQKNSRR